MRRWATSRAPFDSNAKALGDGCNAIALAAVSSTADTTGPVPTCTGDLALAARTNDAAFCLHAAGLVLAG